MLTYADVYTSASRGRYAAVCGRILLPVYRGMGRRYKIKKKCKKKKKKKGHPASLQEHIGANNLFFTPKKGLCIVVVVV